MGKAAFRALLKNWCGLSKELHAHTEKGIGSRHYSRYLSRPGLLPPDGGCFCDALGAADIRRIPDSKYGFSRTSCGKSFAAGFEVRFHSP